MIDLLYPEFVFLLALPFLVRLFFPGENKMYGQAIRVPFLNDFAKIDKIAGVNSSVYRGAQKFNKSFWILFLIWSLLVMAAIRPVLIGSPIRIKNESRDILMVMDISTSMLEDDFSYQGRRINRLTAVKAAASDFVEKRSGDKIGLILFGTRAYLQAPLTFDHQSVKQILWAMDAGMAGNSTSIGDALGLALKSLRQSGDGQNNKVIILLTDGENNDGSLSLPQAVALARSEGVKIYTIGVGGGGFSLANAFFGIKNAPFDEKSLQELAEETKGRYFRADDLKSLANVYRQIDLLEPVEHEANFIYPQKELYFWPLIAAIILSMYFAYELKRRWR